MGWGGLVSVLGPHLQDGSITLPPISKGIIVSNLLQTTVFTSQPVRHGDSIFYFQDIIIRYVFQCTGSVGVSVC